METQIEYDFLNDLKSGKIASMIKEEIKGEALQSSIETFNVMKPIFGVNADTEIMYCIFLNAKNRIISIEAVTEGSLSAAVVYPREIIKRALKARAAAFIMVHNHPSGDPAPSPEDKAITFSMFLAARSIGITLHEHMIIGSGLKYFSFADNMLMMKFKQRYETFCRETF